MTEDTIPFDAAEEDIFAYDPEELVPTGVTSELVDLGGTHQSGDPVVVVAASESDPDFSGPEEPELEAPDPRAGYVEVPTLDHMRIKHVLRITAPNQFLEIFESFEDQIEAVMEPLCELLNKVIMSREVTQLDLHAAEVDSYRQRVSRYLSLTVAFVEHGKSSRFIMKKTKGYAEFDREAHKRSMTAGFVALQVRLECMLTDIDFRVNNCKKFDSQERGGFKNFGGRISESAT